MALLSWVGCSEPQEGLGNVLQNADDAYQGYTLIAPMAFNTTYLMDMDGNAVHQWESDLNPAVYPYLLEDGSILRGSRIKVERGERFGAGGHGGRVDRIGWDGELLWSFDYRSDKVYHHHDIEPLPNGNVLIIAWEHKTPEQALAAGRLEQLLPEDGMWVDHIIEVEPVGDSGGNIVWQWHVWDHLGEGPRQVNINAGNDRADWNHSNAIDYNAELDQILLTVHGFNEVWIIDHSTTTEEAATGSGGRSGHGGDLLYRWGNPESYGRGDGGDRTLFRQHDAEWIGDGLDGAGDILLFNNGRERPDVEYSRVEQFRLPGGSGDGYPLEDGVFAAPQMVWSHEAKPRESFYSRALSGAQRLPNGNTLICEGRSGNVFEVRPDGEQVWQYVQPNTDPDSEEGNDNLFRADRYRPDHPALVGRDL